MRFMVTALRNIFAPPNNPELVEYPFETAARAFKVLGRVDPTAGEADLDTRDVHRILGRMLDTLEGEQHGMERLYRIVCERKRSHSEDGESPCAAWLEETRRAARARGGRRVAG